MSNDTFDQLFEMPSAAARAQLNPPTHTATASPVPVPTTTTMAPLTGGHMPTTKKAVQKVLRNGSNLRDFTNPHNLRTLRDDLKRIYKERDNGKAYLNGNRLVEVLDEKSQITGEKIKNGTWRDFVEGLDELGKLQQVGNNKNFTNKHCDAIKRLWKRLGADDISF